MRYGGRIMKIIIQCAKGKKKNAGCLKTTNSKNILFIANPNIATETGDYVYHSPKDITEKNITWTNELARYNELTDNYFNLLPAYELYENNIYREIVSKFGIENVFILSAGWGLIRADFLTPNYNITFSNRKKEFKRDKKENYPDLCHLQLDSADDLVFLGGIDYQPLFDKLTSKYCGRRIVFYNSVNLPKIKNCYFIKYETRQKTNWHYSCAKKIIDGTIIIE
jgi:hypothetical protein